MPVFMYDDEEWENLIEADPGWSRAETDYLLDMAARFDLRFLVIADRYQVRTLDPSGASLAPAPMAAPIKDREQVVSLAK